MEKVNMHISDRSLVTIVPKSHNTRGRPTLEKVTKFSPQPKSIVSQMLNRMRSRKNIPERIVTKDATAICNSPPSEECSQTEISKEVENITQINSKQFSCDYQGCTYSCKLSSNLIKHKRVHTNDRPYLCDQCSFRSNFVNSLKVHKRTHTSERPYPCKHCNYRCNSSSNLKKHCLHRHPEVIKGN